MADKKNMTFYEKVNLIQTKLVAQKKEVNRFGNYKYRSLESILGSLKPLLAETGLIINFSDDIIMIENRFYVKSTATLTDGDKCLTSSAFAREQENKKGMDLAQVTGSCSSYARKYAICSLLAIDNEEDPDAKDNRKEGGDLLSNLSYTELETLYNWYLKHSDSPDKMKNAISKLSNRYNDFTSIINLNKLMESKKK